MIITISNGFPILLLNQKVFILPLFHLTWIRTLVLLFAFSYGCFAVLKRTPKYMKTVCIHMYLYVSVNGLLGNLFGVHCPVNLTVR